MQKFNCQIELATALSFLLLTPLFKKCNESRKIHKNDNNFHRTEWGKEGGTLIINPREMQSLNIANQELNIIKLSTADDDPRKETPMSNHICIHQRLKNLYLEEFSKPHHLPQFNLHKSYLLDKLVLKEKFNMVVITLYPFAKGYTISYSTEDNQILQNLESGPIPRPYVQDSLLDYIDKEELPPPFLQHWEETLPQLFYSGCVIVKIKDLRYTVDPQIRHVLLKPHTQSIMNDINLIILDQTETYSTEDKISVECAIVNAVQNPLCLDPSLETGIRRLHSHFLKNSFNTTPLCSSVYKNSQFYVKRKRRCEDLGTINNRHLRDCIAKKQQFKSVRTMSTPLSKDFDNVVLLKDLEKESKSVSQLGRPIEKLCTEAEVDYTPKLIEEYILEPEHLMSTISEQQYHIKLEILQRPANSEYVGTLYVDKEYKEGENNGAGCSFTLGSKANASRYINQFKDIFTKEGGKSVRITQSVSGQPSIENCTRAVERDSKNHKTIRRHNNGNTIVKIRKNTTRENLQHSIKNSSKISVPQLQQGTSGKSPNTVNVMNCSVDRSFKSNGTSISHLTKCSSPNTQTFNRNIGTKHKYVARKVTVDNEKITMEIEEDNISLSQMGASNINQTINLSSIAPSLSNLRSASLKRFKSGILINVGSLASTSTGAVQSVHIVPGTNEKSVVSNRQNNATSSLSLSLPGLSALLADPSLTNSQLTALNKSEQLLRHHSK